MSRIFLTLILILIALAGSFQAAAQRAMEEPNWDLALARHAADSIDARPALERLFRMAREGRNEQLLRELDRIALESDWPEPARDKVLHGFAAGLADLPAWSVGPAVLNFLERYEPQTWVPHEEHPGTGVPLDTIRVGAEGLH